MELRIHLKVCEGCGCLWYRTQVETRVYCTSCENRFKEFPTPVSRKRRGRPKKTTLSTVFAVQASAQSIWEGDFAPAFEPEDDEQLNDSNTLDRLSPRHDLRRALLATQASAFSLRGTLAGGAQ
jgi:hypothetical protein